MFKNNPILFKDLLISLNSKKGKILIFFFIFIYFLAFLLFLSGIKDSYIFFETPSIGNDLFKILGFTQLFIITLISYFRGLSSVSLEKTKKTLEFITISPITASKFILGKFLANFSFIILLFIISLPFLAISLVLGGINTSDVLVYSLYTISYSSFAILLGILISTISRNTTLSITLGIAIVPLVFLYFMYSLGYITNILKLYPNESIGINTFLGIFPIHLFEYFSPDKKIINFFGLKISYLIFHIIFFGLANFFLFNYAKKQYKKISFSKINTFYFLETFILILLFGSLANIFSNTMFILIFSCFTFIYLIFNLNENKNLKQRYLYFGITFIILSIFIFIFYGFAYHTIFILFLIYLFIFLLKDFLVIFFKKLGTGAINIFFLLSLILFFYIIPLVFTNLLNIKLNTIDPLIKTSLYFDNALEYKCVEKEKLDYFQKNKKIENNDNIYGWNSYKCRNIEKNGIKFYYFLYLFINLFLIILFVLLYIGFLP